MQMIITEVELLPGSARDCAEMFQTTTPDLVRAHPDWVSARMVIEPETNIIRVMALWRNGSSYEKLRETKTFQDIMKGFSQYFAGPVNVTITDVLVDISSDMVA